MRIEYEVCCCQCGDYFALECDDGSLGWIFGECPHCGEENEHLVVERDD